MLLLFEGVVGVVERDGTEREGGECAAREAVGGEEAVGVERASELFPPYQNLHSDRI